MAVRPLTGQLKGAPGVEIVTIDTTPIADTDGTFKIGLVGWTPKGEPNVVTTVRDTVGIGKFGAQGKNYVHNQPFYAMNMFVGAGATTKFVRVAAEKEYLNFYSPRLSSVSTGYNTSSAASIDPSAASGTGYAGYYNSISSVLAGSSLYTVAPYTSADSPFTVWSKYPGMDTIAVSFHTHIVPSAGLSGSLASSTSLDDVYVLKAIQNLGYYNDYSASDKPYTDIISKLGVLKVYDYSNSTGTPVETIIFTNEYMTDANGTQYHLEEVTKNSKYIRAKINQNYQATNSTWCGHGGIGHANVVTLSGGSVGTYSSASVAWALAWKLFLDTDAVKVDCLCSMGTNLTGFGSEIAGIPNESFNLDVMGAMKDVCNTRNTCFGIVDAPKHADIDELITIVNEVVPGSPDYNCLALYDNRDAMVDVATRRNVELAKSVTVATVIANMRNKSVLWDIPANVQNGSLPYPIVGQAYKRKYPDQIGALKEARINPTRISSKGMYLFGNNTLQRANTPQRDLNVIMLKCYAYTVIQDYLDNLVFRLNTPELRRSISKYINTFLKGIATANPAGLASFGVVCDDSNNPPEVTNQRRLIVETEMVPYLGAETISLYNYIKFAGED